MEHSPDAIFEVVKKHLCEIVDDVPPDDVTLEGSMKDLGASSLDIVEVVSCSMRELRVKVPRQELSKVTNLGGLVDLLHTAMLEKAS